MTEKVKKKLLEYFRWVAVIPCGVLCAFLSSFPLHWILYSIVVSGNIIEMPLEDIVPIENFLYPIVNSIFFVYVGAKTAPKKHLLVSVILSILSILFRIILLAIAKVLTDVTLDMSFFSLLRAILAALSGGLGVYWIYAETKHFKKNKETI